MFSETMLGGFNGSKSINMTLDYSHNVSGFNAVAVASYIILVISLKVKTRYTAHLTSGNQWYENIEPTFVMFVSLLFMQQKLE